jgi:hypothetical protein
MRQCAFDLLHIPARRFAWTKRPVTALGAIATNAVAPSDPDPGDISGTWLAVALLSIAMWSAYGGLPGAHATLWANPHYQRCRLGSF